MTSAWVDMNLTEPAQFKKCLTGVIRIKESTSKHLEAWVAYFDVNIKKPFEETVKDIFVRYPVRIVRWDVDPECNLWVWRWMVFTINRGDWKAVSKYLCWKRAMVFQRQMRLVANEHSLEINICSGSPAGLFCAMLCR